MTGMNDGDDPKKGGKGIEDIFSGLKHIFGGEDKPPLPPPPGAPPKPDAIESGLPPDCPVTPLGRQGRIYYYLNSMEQLEELPAEKHNRHTILGLFGGNVGWLKNKFPVYSRELDGEGKHPVVSWRVDAVEAELMRECTRKGVWNSWSRVRGPGAWPDGKGGLILHLGDCVLMNGEEQVLGLIDGYLYQRDIPRPRPAKQHARGGPNGPGMQVLNIFESWNWRRPETDPTLMLGNWGAGFVGGALPWRPVTWPTGPTTAGKSTLFDRVIEPLYGTDGVVHVSDPTEAGVRQLLRYTTLPALVDELENDADPRKKQTVALARLAASGGRTARGSAAHTPHDFELRSCFTFAGVTMPPLMPQDRNRIAVLDLQVFPRGAQLPDLKAERMRSLGSQLRRRMIDQWPRFSAVHELFRGAMLQAGHDARGADVYGTLLACADLLLHDDHPTSDDLVIWAERLSPSRLTADHDDTADWVNCYNHLMGSLVDPRRTGERRTIGQLIEDELKRHVKQHVPSSGNQGKPVPLSNPLLDTCGVKLIIESGAPFLVVANTHPGLLAIYKETPWAGLAGAAVQPWTTSLRRAPHAEAQEALRFAGAHVRGTKLPFG